VLGAMKLQASEELKQAVNSLKREQEQAIRQIEINQQQNLAAYQEEMTVGNIYTNI